MSNQHSARQPARSGQHSAVRKSADSTQRWRPVS